MKKKNYFSKGKALAKSALLSTAMLFSASMYADIIVPDGLVVYYDFDTADQVDDMSGNSQHGTLAGNATNNLTVGKVGPGALSLQTVATPAADYVLLPEGITEGLDNFTVATWVYPTGTSQWARVFDFGENGADNMFLTVNRGSNIMRFAIKVGGGSEQQIDGPVIATNAWSHVAVMIDYTTGIGSLYVNGFLAGTNKAMTAKPSQMAGSSNNAIGRSQPAYGDPAYTGYIDDFRVYNRVITASEMLELAGYTTAQANAIIEMNSALTLFEEATVGNVLNTILGQNASFSEIWDNLNLISSLASYPKVILTWESSNEAAVSNTGVVTQTNKVEPVTLTLTLSHPDLESVVTKEFSLIVESENPLPTDIALFTFETTEYRDGKLRATSKSSANDQKYTGSFENGAKKRTIGADDNQYVVLDLGNNNGYFDMGEQIGEMFYQLGDYTMCGFFLVEEDAINVTSAGGFYWVFANTNDMNTDRNGGVFFRPWASVQSITQTYWSNSVGVGVDNYYVNSTTASGEKPAYLGTWHHVMFTQSGTTGTVYVDGVQVAQNESMNVLPLHTRAEDRIGTLYNYLGRSCYAGDAYMNKTLLHDFRVYSIDASVDFSEVLGFDIETELSNLNAAYQANDGRDAVNEDLNNAYVALDIDVTAFYEKEVTNANKLTLPTSLDAYSGVTINWASSNSALMDAEGQVMQAKYYDYTLESVTATLVDTNTGESLQKTFDLNSLVLAIEGTQLSDDVELLVHYDFSQFEGRVITDATAQALKGELKGSASVLTLGTEGTTEVFNVLDLTNESGTGYFDMGTEIGQFMYHMDDFTLSMYYYIDTLYTGLNTPGNFIWTFANTETSGNALPYFGGLLKGQRAELYSASGTEYQLYNTGTSTNAEQGKWVHLMFTQEGDMVSLYVSDLETGVSADPETSFDEMTLSSALPAAGFVGTTYNWIGRSNWGGDVNLQALVADVRLYNRAILPEDLEDGGVIEVVKTLEALTLAMEYKTTNEETEENLNSLNDVRVDFPYTLVQNNGVLSIVGLTGTEKVTLFDVTGRVVSANASSMSVRGGIYVVKVDNHVAKVVVR